MAKRGVHLVDHGTIEVPGHLRPDTGEWFASVADDYEQHSLRQSKSSRVGPKRKPARRDAPGGLLRSVLAPGSAINPSMIVLSVCRG